MKIVFFDTETTGNAGEDRLCQLGIKERAVAEPIANALYKPPMAITHEAMAVHHITQKMVDDKPAFRDAQEYAALKSLFENPDTVAVAHNASFDIGILSREDIVPARHICTYKVARELDVNEELGQYKLQYLRYRYGLEIDASAHDAWGDVLVLEGVFERLLQEMVAKVGDEEAALSQMMEISSRPLRYSSLRFGKYAGKKIADIAKEDRGYLEWLLKEKRKNAEEDWIATLEYYLKPQSA